MTLDDDFFSEFPPVSKEEWLRQIAKDLKDRPLEELDWQASEGLRVSPFAHADDFQEQPLPFSEQANNWEIGELVEAGELAAANRQALNALEGGVEGLRFWLESPLDLTAFGHLLDGIYLDFVSLHFSGPGMEQNPGMVLANLERLAKDAGLSPQDLRGSLAYDPARAEGIVDWRYLADLLDFAKQKFPKFWIVTVDSSLTATPPPTSPPKGRGDASGMASKNGEANNTTADIASVENDTKLEAPLLPFGGGVDVGKVGGGVDTSEALAAILRRANLYLQKLSERGIAPAQAAAQMQFSVAIGKSYFLEIARLRAFKLLWLNVLKGWGVPLHYPCVEAYFQPEAYTDELYTNMVRATTMAMSAVLGGADRLTVLPYDTKRETQAAYPKAFSRRIARNVQHLLKMESGLHEIPDPAAGSFYIEKLTLQIAEQAWRHFQSEVP